MSYTRFDTSKPNGAVQTGPQFSASANANDDALFDMIGCALIDGHAYSQSGGTAEEPATISLTNGLRILQAALTWTSGNITAITFSLATDGVTFNTIGSAASFSYDGGGNLTTSTAFGGVILKVFELLGKYKATRTAYNAHAAATGAAVHGLGTISTQAASAVAITGGNIDGTVIGATTRALATFLQARGVHASATFGATTTLDWSAAESFDFTATGTGAATLAFSNPPAAGVRGWIDVEITNGGLRTWTWPTGMKWVGGVAPTLSSSGLDILSFRTRDGGTTYMGFAGKGMA